MVHSGKTYYYHMYFRPASFSAGIPGILCVSSSVGLKRATGSHWMIYSGDGVTKIAECCCCCCCCAVVLLLLVPVVGVGGYASVSVMNEHPTSGTQTLPPNPPLIEGVGHGTWLSQASSNKDTNEIE